MRRFGRLPSAPPSEPTLRRLGVRSSSQLDRPIRGQTIIAVSVLVVLIALPLYLLRRPAEKVAAEESGRAPTNFLPSVPASPKEPAVDSRVSLGTPEKVRCGASPTAVGQSGRLCDSLPFFEAGLSDAIKNAVDCAPRTREGGTLNYVLKIDFSQKQLHVFPGASGGWRGPQARHATKCVKLGLKAPDWDKIEHQYRYYEIAILATYRAPEPSTTPLFE
jgi:hypothetical protein